MTIAGPFARNPWKSEKKKFISAFDGSAKAPNLTQKSSVSPFSVWNVGV